MLKFAICDDDPFMRKEIANHLSKYSQKKHMPPCCVNCFSNGRSLLESGCDFDLIFLDIQMDHPDGMETARMLRQRKSRSLLIFVTVLKEYVFDAFAVEAYDYLIKPLSEDRFAQTMDRAIQSFRRRKAKSIIVQKGTSCEVILFSQIAYCEVQGRKIYIHQGNGQIIDYYNKLKNFEQQADSRFFKCHRSYLVNLDHIRKCDAGRITLSQGDEIPVSRLRERDLTQALLRRMKEREF